MNRLQANILSIVLHPLIMPFYGMVLLLSATFLAVYPLKAKLFYAGIVLLFTLLLPFTFLASLWKIGRIGNAEISNRKERLIPYLFTVACYIACLVVLYKASLPLWAILFFFGAALAMVLNVVINLRWKISAHLTGIGGLAGSVFAVCKLLSLNPTIFFMILVVSAGLLGSARVKLEQHTLGQVFAGFFCGFVCVFFSMQIVLFFF